MANVWSLTQMLQLGPGSDPMAGRDQSGGCDGEVSLPRHPPADLLRMGFFPTCLTFPYVKRGRVGGHRFADLTQRSSLFGYAGRRLREQPGREETQEGRAAAASSLNEQSTGQLPYASSKGFGKTQQRCE